MNQIFTQFQQAVEREMVRILKSNYHVISEKFNIPLEELIREAPLNIQLPQVVSTTSVLEESPVLSTTSVLEESPVLSTTSVLEESPVLSTTSVLEESPVLSTSDSLEKKTLKELRQICKDLNIKSSNMKKNEIIRHIREHADQHQNDAFDNLSKVELQKLCKEKQIPKYKSKMKRVELIELLKDYELLESEEVVVPETSVSEVAPETSVSEVVPETSVSEVAPETSVSEEVVVPQVDDLVVSSFEIDSEEEDDVFSTNTTSSMSQTTQNPSYVFPSADKKDIYANEFMEGIGSLTDFVENQENNLYIQTDFGSMPSSRLEKMCKDRNLNITGKRQNEWRAMLEADEEQRMKCLLAIENDSIL